MNEQFIIDKLILHGINYHKFGNVQDEISFTQWMDKLKNFKEFDSIEEACDYFLAQGEMQGEKLSA